MKGNYYGDVKMKKYSLYLFDFDYTLANSEAGIVGCFEHVFEINGITGIERDAIKRTIGMRLEDEFCLLTNTDDSERLDLFRKQFVEKANEIMTARTELFPQTLPMLKRLKASGAKIGIISTKQRFRIQETIEKYEMQKLIDLVIGATDVQDAKPSPEGIWKALDYFKIKKEDTLYVGDSLIDAKAGQNAEVDFAAVLTGTTRREEFIPYPSVLIMDTFDEL